MCFSEQVIPFCFVSLQKKQNWKKKLPPHGAYGTIHFAFEVSKEEYSTALVHIKNSGIEILHEHLWKNNCRSFYFKNPDAHIVEIIEQGVWEQNTCLINN